MLNVLRFLRRHGPRKTVQRIADRLYIKVVFAIKPARVRSMYGPRFTANFADATFGFYIRADYGRYFADFIRNMPTPFVFMDIGANQGLYSVLAAQNSRCRRVWAFEPVEQTHALLRANIALNPHADKVELIDAAISDEDGPKRIFANPTHSGGASLEHAIDGAVGLSIRCISSRVLHDVVRTHPEDRILVKIDTEGHEPVVIAELRKSALWPQVECLFFEVDMRWFDGNEVARQLASDGFEEVHRTSSEDHYDVMMRRSSPR